ncbi:hypothetical protein [Candidatus Methylacidithermus pantelleriae]|uniref:Uncharacterized protein n=1 Tax=Candidatus Methylacidithermus pantelleriae TaxID=2744239 RepID=A0A8J2BQB6_9BACT|nr:hypothetical protein [Candidatus Methylacidithermus pantelleriae]CAF0688866.1 hypothetical protein MPNT_10033 [Candidatus Methylacidithermus pantelleriae]
MENENLFLTPWGRKESQTRGAFFFFLFLSFLSHLAILVLVPAREEGFRLPVRTFPSPRVFALVPGRKQAPFAEDLGFWIRLRDPSSVVRPPNPVSVTPEELPQSLRNPPKSSSRPGPGLVPAPPWVPVAPVPDLTQLAKEKLSFPWEEFHYPAHAKVIPLPEETTIQWEGTKPNGTPWDGWSLPSVTIGLVSEAHPTVLRLGVDARGTVKYVLLEESSGKAEHDQLAWKKAHELLFPPSPRRRGLEWTRAYVLWHFTEPKEAKGNSP